MRIFLDTNILLDIIESRPDFVEKSTAVLILSEKMGASLFIAWHGLATIYYLIRRGRSEQAAMIEIDKLLGWAEIAPVHSSSAERARSFNLPDFEDAMQCAAAEGCLADLIITRNINDFKNGPIPSMAPADFLSRYESS